MSGLNVHVFECDVAPMAAPTAVGQHWVDVLTGETWISVGTSSVADWVLVNQEQNRITIGIPAGDTLDLDAIPLSNLCLVKYIVCVASMAEDKWRSFEMLAGKKTSTTVEDSLYARIGSNIDVDFNFDIVGTEAKLIGINNEAFDVVVKIDKNTF